MNPYLLKSVLDASSTPPSKAKKLLDNFKKSVVGYLFLGFTLGFIVLIFIVRAIFAKYKLSSIGKSHIWIAIECDLKFYLLK